MSCRKSKNVMLYFYGELPDDAKAAMEAHLHVCVSCRKELQELQQMRSVSPTPTVSDTILQPTRRALFYKLRHSQMSAREPHSSWMQIGKLTVQAGLAAALVFFGFMLGGKEQPQSMQPAFSVHDLITASNEVAMKDGAISPYLMGINKITVNALDGTVEIDYNTMNDVTIRGAADDPTVQLMLQNALQMTEAPATRLRAIKAVQAMAITQKTLDDSYVEALGHVLLRESNVGIKLSALKTLELVLQSPTAREVLVQSMLTDEDQAIRIQAFKSLVLNSDFFTDMETILLTTKSDTNTYIRSKSLQILQQGKDAHL